MNESILNTIELQPTIGDLGTLKELSINDATTSHNIRRVPSYIQAHSQFPPPALQPLIRFVPPLNFALVDEGVYRSGHPLPINYPFLEKLRLKTIIYLGDRQKEDNKDYIEWAAATSTPTSTSKTPIKLHYFHVQSAKEPYIENDPEKLTQALNILLDTRNYPVLIHSNKGKHRIGVLVGVMRKMLQGWCLAGIFDEYAKFAAGKGDGDVEFIETFETILEYNSKYAPAWLRRD
ncbi:hypothetical protein NADFUDRAFT_81305 [Nadsonia fulvescens var. elongata DSM 6958]|uniref:Tyrosine-protein phosphatase domain-containing protein n=1 Tax=Nadsonia fulvescens var. elongata DSM 6958 TaxID=857566 RepID=A0A1E3PSP2_9ASCO|nr:hypothetical protein NADFUDRAFT_81305 [Nadsonia fulvescens var. elongata DSM 6958]